MLLISDHHSSVELSSVSEQRDRLKTSLSEMTEELNALQSEFLPVWLLLSCKYDGQDRPQPRREHQTPRCVGSL